MTENPGYRLTRDAQADLISIRRYTQTKWGQKQSLKYLSDVRKVLLLLSGSPSMGRPCLEVGEGVFCFFYSSHVIYYINSKTQLVVFGVLHKSMVPALHLSERV